MDIVCTQLVQRPEAFDVLVMPMQYGDILSDLCAGLVGRRGMIPGATSAPRRSCSNPATGAPRTGGTDRANPMATMLSGVLMLRHLGEPEAAERLEGAIADSSRRQHVTYDQPRRRQRRRRGRARWRRRWWTAWRRMTSLVAGPSGPGRIVLRGPGVRAPVSLVLRAVRGGARAYDAPVARVALRAARLGSRGGVCRCGAPRAARSGHRTGDEGWAIRRREVLRMQEALNPPGARRDRGQGRSSPDAAPRGHPDGARPRGARARERWRRGCVGGDTSRAAPRSDSW